MYIKQTHLFDKVLDKREEKKRWQVRRTLFCLNTHNLNMQLRCPSVYYCTSGAFIWYDVRTVKKKARNHYEMLHNFGLNTAELYLQGFPHKVRGRPRE